MFHVGHVSLQYGHYVLEPARHVQMDALPRVGELEGEDDVVLAVTPHHRIVPVVNDGTAGRVARCGARVIPGILLLAFIARIQAFSAQNTLRMRWRRCWK